MSSTWQATPFRDNPDYAGLFAGYLITFLASVVLVVIAFARCRGMMRPARGRATCFGFRWSIVFYAIAMLLSTLDFGLPNSLALPPEFEAISVVANAFALAAEVTVVYATFKTLLTPLGTAGHANAWTLSATIPLTLAALAAFALTAANQALLIAIERAQFDDSYYYSDYSAEDAYRVVEVVYIAMWLLYDAIAVIAGVLMLVATCVAFSRWRGAAGRREPRLMAAVASLWLVRAVLGLAFDVVAYLPSISYTYHTGAFGITVFDTFVAGVALRNILALAIYSIFCHCYRTGRADAEAFDDQNPELAYQHQLPQDPGHGYGIPTAQGAPGNKYQLQPQAAPYPQHGGPSMSPSMQQSGPSTSPYQYQDGRVHLQQ